MKSGKQRQEPAPLRSLQMVFGPQGDGLHGFKYSGVRGASKNFFQIRMNCWAYIKQNFEKNNLPYV